MKAEEIEAELQHPHQERNAHAKGFAFGERIGIGKSHAEFRTRCVIDIFSILMHTCNDEMEISLEQAKKIYRDIEESL